MTKEITIYTCFNCGHVSTDDDSCPRCFGVDRARSRDPIKIPRLLIDLLYEVSVELNKLKDPAYFDLLRRYEHATQLYAIKWTNETLRKALKEKP